MVDALEPLEAHGWTESSLPRLLVDPATGRILEASQGAADFYGCSREALRQRSAWDLLADPARLEELREAGQELGAERLRQAERRWKLALEGASHGVWDWDVATGAVEFSAGWKAMLGYSEDEIRGHVSEWERLVHPDDLAPTMASVQASLAGETPVYECVHRLRCRDGSWKWILDRGAVFERDEAGQPRRMVGTHTDISAQKQAEASVRESEQRFRELFEHLPVPYQSLDSEGRWLDANAPMARLLGVEGPEDLVGRSFPEFLEESNRRSFVPLFEEFKRTGVFQGEAHLRRRDGAPVTVVASARVQVDGAGRFVRTHSVLTDISERRAMEEQIRALNAALEGRVEERTAELVAAKEHLQRALAEVARSEARYRLAVEATSEGLWDLDLVTGEQVVNEAWFTLLGYEPGEVEPSYSFLRSRLHPEDLTRFECAFQEALEGCIPRFECVYRIFNRDGEVRWHRGVGKVVARDSGGSAVRVVGTMADLTDRVEAEQRIREAMDLLQAANEAKSEFVAHMSHEIRTPLNGVLGLAQLLGRDALTGRQRDLVERIQAAGRSLLALLNDALDLSKIEAGQLHLEDNTFELGAVLGALESLFRDAARAKGLSLSIRGPVEGPGLLVGDRLRLEQVLLNLLGNAVKFTSRGGVRVRVEVREPGDTALRLRFEVRDTGIGISPEALGRLFTPFTQGDSGIARRFGGTGLGLSISRRLVELMGGEIGVESQVGEGSTFWFELPFGRDLQARTPLPSPGRESAGPRLSGLRLLVVDDNSLNLDLLEQLLEVEGAHATLATNGQEAVQILEALPGSFDAVLMDLLMPVMDGVEAVRRIRGELGMGDLPILVLTAGVVAERLEEARAAGASEVLTKPLDLEKLVDSVSRWVSPGAAGETPPEPAPRAGGPVSEALEALDGVPGIDRGRVEAIFAGLHALYPRMLGQFLEQFAEVAEATRRELAAGDREAATLRIHTLRGGAGHLGARDLMALATSLEAALDRGEVELDGPLATLEQEFAALRAACAPWLERWAPADP